MHFTLQEKVVPAGVAAAKPEWMQWENELWEISQYLFTVRLLNRAVGPKGRAGADAVLCAPSVRALSCVRQRSGACLFVCLSVRPPAGPGFSRLQLWCCQHWAPSPRAFALCVCLLRRTSTWWRCGRC